MKNNLVPTNAGAGEYALRITAQYPAEKYNLLVPMQTVTEIADTHRPVMNAVQISTDLADKEIYVQEKPKAAWKDKPATPAGYALTKKGLNKLMRAAGIKILGTRPVIPSTCQKCAEVNKSIGRPVNCGSCGNKDVKFEARISVPQLTGENIEISAHKEIIVADATDGMTEAQRKEFLKFRSEMCETKAINRALRAAMHIKGTYTIEELRKPFVVAYLVIAQNINPIQQALAREAELTEKHTQYERAAARLAELEALKPDLEAAIDRLTAARLDLDEIDREHKWVKAQADQQITSLKEKAAMLESSGCLDAEKATCKFLKDAISARDYIPIKEAAEAEYEDSYQKARQEAAAVLSAAQEEYDGKKHITEEIDALVASLRSLETAEREYTSLDALRSELTLHEERAAEYEDAAEMADGAEKTSTGSLEDVMRKLKDAEQAYADYERLQQQITAARQWLDKEKQLPVARERKTAAATRLMEIEAEIETVETELAEAQKEFAEEQSKITGKEELEAQVSAVEAEIRSFQKEARVAAIALGSLRQQEEQAAEKRAEAAELQALMNALGGTAAGYEELKKAFSQDGIPHNIIRSIIPVFEATATNILGQMSQGRMSVEFVTEKVLKSNAKKEVTTLDIIINDSSTGRLPYTSRSGGERVKAALSVILALSEIKSSKAGIQLGFLFIDEPPFLDQPGVQAYCDALEAIQQQRGDLKVIGNVGIDVQRGAAGDVSDDGGQGFDVHSMFQRGGRECVSQIVEAYLLAPCPLKDRPQPLSDSIWVPGRVLVNRGGEHPLGGYGLLVFFEDIQDRRRNLPQFFDSIVNFFEASTASRSALFGCLLLGIFFVHPCRCSTKYICPS